jgi:hypothetical protein
MPEQSNSEQARTAAVFDDLLTAMQDRTAAVFDDLLTAISVGAQHERLRAARAGVRERHAFRQRRAFRSRRT